MTRKFVAYVPTYETVTIANDSEPTDVWIGVDCSTKGTALVAIDKHLKPVLASAWGSNDPDPQVRLESLHRWALDLAEDISALGACDKHYSIESPFFRGPRSKDLIRAQGAVMGPLSAEWAEYSPQTLRATIGKYRGSRVGKEKKPGIEALETAGDLLPLIYQAAWDGGPGLPPRQVAIGDLADAAWCAIHDRDTYLKELAKVME